MKRSAVTYALSTGAVLLVLHEPELLGGSAFVVGEVSTSGPAASPVWFFVATAPCRALMTTQNLLAISPPVLFPTHVRVYSLF